uniref:tRNA (34-2'-O)-methyltransferase regulator WDR6 n=1 Tax=Labrus bergylta TaxID=56723 RepID=A0A3Q3ESA0_9LABR
MQRQAPSCQVIQVASHRLDKQWERRRNRHKTVKMDPETRYMSVVVVDEKTDCVLLAVACSDGAIRLFSVIEGKRQIELLWETFYHQRCVLSQCHKYVCVSLFVPLRFNLLFSAATDGKIAVWDFTEASFISTDALSNTPASRVPCLVIPAHQSGINSLAVWKETLEQQEGCCLVTVASGGDDGQLTVSTVRVQYPDEGKTGRNQLNLYLNSQSHVPLAHAAPLTDLKLLSPGLLVSTSSDQRVFLWRVSSTGISHSGAVFSHVADVDAGSGAEHECSTGAGQSWQLK